MRTFFLATCAGLSVGCASISNLQTADTLGKGNFAVAVEPGVWGGANTSLPSSTTNPSWLPHVDVAARIGVSEGVDLGLRAGLSFLELQAKFLFTKPGAPGVTVSFAPTAGGLVLGTGASGVGLGLINVGLPVLIGFKTSGGSEFVLGPRVQNLVLFSGAATGGAGTVYGLGAGGSIGFFIRFTDNFGLMPEASVVAPLLGASAFASQLNTASTVNTGVFLFQFKLGVVAGKFRPAGVPLPDTAAPPSSAAPAPAPAPPPAPAPSSEPPPPAPTSPAPLPQ